MSTRDPFQPIVPFRHQEAQPDPLREFYSEYGTRIPRPQRRDLTAALGLCVFQNGREVRRGADCPHFREPEEDSGGD